MKNGSILLRALGSESHVVIDGAPANIHFARKEAEMRNEEAERQAIMRNSLFALVVMACVFAAGFIAGKFSI